MTTRLIVKNLPTNCTEAQLRKFYGKYGKLSDASLKYTKEGKFRGFAFVGFLDDEHAAEALAKTNQTFFNSKKLTVEPCRPFGDANKPRAWSKYAKDSSAYKRAHGEESEETGGNSGKSDDFSEPRAKKSKNDAKFDQFMEAKGVAVEKEVELSKDKSEEAKKLMKELMEGIEGDTSLSLIFTGLPSSAKGKNIKEWLNPIRVKAMKISRNDDVAAAFVTFNRPPDVRRALQKDGQFLGGFKIGIEKVETPEPEVEMSEEHGAELQDRQKEEESVREKILETGRLFLRNLPFSTTEDDLQFLFKKYGEVSEVQVVINKATGDCKGFAIVEFVFPEAAVAAYSALDGYVFKGRMMHILPGDERREKPTEEEGDGDAEDADDPDNPMKEEDAKKKKQKGEKKKTFKEEKAENQKANASKTAHSWNALFLGANAIADTLAQRLNVKKSDLLNSDSGESAGVRLALAETRLVRETRDFFIENGVKLDAFSKPATKRSDTVMLAKNLPAGVETDELQRMFEKYGDCQKVLMPAEGGVSALILMGNPVDAKKAFRALAYSRFRSQPLYLEWAPYDVMGDDQKAPEDTRKAGKSADAVVEKKSKREMTYEERRKERKNRQAGITEEEEEEEDDQEAEEEDKSAQKQPEDQKPAEKRVEKEIESGSTLFVKNLAFDTTDGSLDALFRKRYGDRIKSAQISKKLNPAEPTKPLSMGFGFVQFYTALDAKTALKEMQGELLEGHSLELKISHRENVDKGALRRKEIEQKEQGESTKLLVRNLPFEASVKEVESLFGTFGAVKNIRIPHKAGLKSQHRGFGFVDFISADEARRAFDSLVHSTHLYGRRLVLEWAKEDETVEELRTKTAEKFGGADKKAKKAKSKAATEQFQQQLQIADDEKD